MEGGQKIITIIKIQYSSRHLFKQFVVQSNTFFTR